MIIKIKIIRVIISVIIIIISFYYLLLPIPTYNSLHLAKNLKCFVDTLRFLDTKAICCDIYLSTNGWQIRSQHQTMKIDIDSNVSSHRKNADTYLQKKVSERCPEKQIPTQKLKPIPSAKSWIVNSMKRNWPDCRLNWSNCRPGSDTKDCESSWFSRGGMPPARAASSQEKRFRRRMEDPVRQWKLSPMDLESRRRWFSYSRARDEMLSATDTDWAPWYVVRSDDKRRARLNCISHLLSLIPYEALPQEKIELTERDKSNAYDDVTPLQLRNQVPEIYWAPKQKKTIQYRLV